MIRGAAIVWLSFLLLAGACGGATKGEASSRGSDPLPAGKLPEGIRPTSYRLSLTVIPEDETFSGTAVIGIELDEPTRTIWMHGENLNVASVHATQATVRVEGTWEQRTPDGVSRIELREPLPAGRSTLHFEYTAPFDTTLRGLYKVKSKGLAYAFTQFESISARLAFPCFDEPRFKTPFDLTLTVPAGQVAAANTPIDRAINLPDGRQRISFMPTPPLPTYLVALAVGPLDVVSGPTIAPTETRPFPIPLRGIAARGQGEQLRYALERTGAFVRVLEDYFGISYPYAKLDLVAVPDFAAGAMENVGLITFREWLLLVDERNTTESQRRMFAYVMAHELAHQWFGNLVTMPWWDDIWLNESFATWMGNKVVHTLYPEYRSDLATVASAHRAMRVDSLVSARSIRQPVETNRDIHNAFSAITYNKGGAVLAMFEHSMGAERFREAIRLYLRRHQGRTATSEDLLAALDEVGGAGVAASFRTFLNQPGVPLVTVTADQPCDQGLRALDLAQERYLPLGSTGDPARQWRIPFCVRHPAEVMCAPLNNAEGQIELPGCPPWWMPNDDGAGYYRFALSPDGWRALRTKGFKTLSDLGRIAVVDSVGASFDRGAISVGDLLEWFPPLASSASRQLATAPMTPLRFMIDHAASDAERDRVARYAGRLYRKRVAKLGWRARPRESSDTKLLREAVVRFMVMDVRDSKLRARAARLGRAYFRDASSPLDPQLASIALATAVQESGEEFFDALVNSLETSADAVTRSRNLSAIGHAESEALSARALGLALDSRLRVNEISQVLGAQFRNARTRDRAWTWLREHFDELAARFGSSQLGMTPWLTASFCTEDAADEVRRFFGARVAELGGGPRNLQGAVEAITLCAKKADFHRASVAEAFRPAARQP